MFKKKSILLSLFIALVTATIVTQVAWAWTYISEASLTRILGPVNSPINHSSPSCIGGNCRYLNQTSGVPSFYRWQLTPSGQYDWSAYIPTIGQAAARYSVDPNEYWYVTVNQANPGYQGNYVYIGFSDNIGVKGLVLHNGCLDGWGCYGLPIYWDSMRYEPH